MVYHFVKYLTRAAIGTFYNKVQIRGLHHMPKSGPVIICSNHTNAFLDALILGSHIPRKMWSLPRGDVFFTSGPILGWLYKKVGMIPIYRALEGKEYMHRNEATFARCFEVLKQGGVISIFPEGICIPERRIKAMKKGAARIILGAEERNNFSLDTKIIFIGLNYERAWRFKTDLFLNCSRTYKIDEFIELYKENTVKGINELTKFLKPELIKQVVHIAKPEYDDFYEQVATVYSGKLISDLGLSPTNLAHRDLISKEIAKGINYHFEENTEEIRKVQEESRLYFKELSNFELDDHILSSLPNKGQFAMRILRTILGFPLHLYGLINNYLPAKIAKTIANKFVKDIDFYSSVTAVVGLCSVLILYPLMVTLFWAVSDSVTLSIIYASTLHLSGNFSAYYVEDLSKLKAIMFYQRFKKSNESKHLELLQKRDSLVQNLSNLTKSYRSRTAK